MPGTQTRAILRELPWRSVVLEADGPECGGSGSACVKRYRDRRWLGRWRDGLRARAELGRLRRLARAGLPVPEVLGLRATPQGPELVTRWIEGAVPLERLLERAGPRPPALARRLGRLLAALHAAGCSHGDLHLSNVLVDPRGAPWLVDARAIRRATAGRIRADLEQAAAAARERTSGRFRAAFLRAYLCALPARLARRLPDERELSAAVERAARVRRARTVDRSAARWLRDSGACAHDRATDVLRARSLEPARAAELLEAARRGAPPAGVRALRGDARALERTWRDAAILAEHGLPAPRPLVFARAEPALALFRAPELAAAAPPASARGRQQAALALGALAEALQDRGLALEPGVLHWGPACGAYVALGARLARPPGWTGTSALFTKP